MPLGVRAGVCSVTGPLGAGAAGQRKDGSTAPTGSRIGRASSAVMRAGLSCATAAGAGLGGAEKEKTGAGAR